MKILVIDGNTAEGNAKSIQAGSKAYGQYYADILCALMPKLQYDIAYPSEEGAGATPRGHKLDDYQGFVWTGSPLNIYKRDEPTKNQLAFGELILKQNKPIFGSCWGLQILVTLLGGEIRRNPKGREIGVARSIYLSDEGRVHKLFHGKHCGFSALAIHYDETARLPQGAKLLASNDFSEIQAMAYEEQGQSIWAVQYHPEFTLEAMSNLFTRLAPQLVAERTFINQAQLEETVADWGRLVAGEDRPDLQFRYGLTKDVLDIDRHQRELINWLNHVNSQA